MKEKRFFYLDSENPKFEKFLPESMLCILKGIR